MPEYLSESVNRSGYLRPGESLEVEFNVQNAGQVVAMASAKWDRLFPIDPTKRLVEIFEPGSANPAASRLDEGWAVVTFLSHPVASTETGAWKARVTNKENSGERFSFTISYPGTIELKTLTVPVAVINAFVNATVGQVSIHLTDGDNSSFIRFPASMGVPEERFTLPRYRKTFNMPWPFSDITVTERVSDINSQSVAATLGNAREGFVNGSLDLAVNFETSGREIRGTVDANVGNMNLAVTLGLAVQNRGITYQTNNVGVSFPIKINLVDVPDFIEDLIDRFTGFGDQIRTAVENAVRNVFASNGTQQAITNALNDQVGNLLGAGAQIVSAKVQGGNLIVKYYNT